jgi:hypothetical protein
MSSLERVPFFNRKDGRRILRGALAQAWRYMSVIPAPETQRLEDHEFEASQGYTVSCSLKKTKNKKPKKTNALSSDLDPF